MRDTGITCEPAKILLLHRDPTAINKVTKCQPCNPWHQTVCSLGKHRQGNSNQRVKAEFLQHACMQHRCSRGRRTVSQWRPGMKRPEGNEDSEPEQKHRKNKTLSARV